MFLSVKISVFVLEALYIDYIYNILICLLFVFFYLYVIIFPFVSEDNFFYFCYDCLESELNFYSKMFTTIVGLIFSNPFG